MQLYLIRHGEVAEEYRNSYYGQMDVPLSEKGLKQSEDVARRLSDIAFDAIYSSDLSRASVLASLLDCKICCTV